MSRSAWGAAASVMVAVVLLVAGVSKVARPTEWRSQSQGLGVPWVLARVVPFVEIVLGALLLVQVQRPLVAWCAAVLFAAFTGLLGLRLAQGRRPPCACFGSLSAKPIGPGHMLRNALFILLALLAALL